MSLLLSLSAFALVILLGGRLQKGPRLLRRDENGQDLRHYGGFGFGRFGAGDFGRMNHYGDP